MICTLSKVDANITILHPAAYAYLVRKKTWKHYEKRSMWNTYSKGDTFHTTYSKTFISSIAGSAHNLMEIHADVC